MQYPKISIVTVALNSEAYIEKCIQSVIGQQYPNLEYIIIDGGSTDATVAIAQKYKVHIAHIVSEPDTGPANALNKGFALATGDIMGWLNTDDMLHHKALYAVADMFIQLPEVNWLMGFPSWYTAKGACMNEIYYPPGRFYHSPDYISDNLYMKFARWSKWRFAMDDYSSIQQESVFWRRELWQQAGSHIKEDIIAYDLELWTRFFLYAQLYTANVLLGGFRVHGNQISLMQKERYMRESYQYIQQFKEKLFAKNRSYRWKVKVAKFWKVMYYYNIPLARNVYPKLLSLPPYIHFDINAKRFLLHHT